LPTFTLRGTNSTRRDQNVSHLGLKMKIDVYLAGKETGFWSSTCEQSFEKSVACVAEHGFDGIELMTGNLKDTNASRIKRITDSHGLDIVAVASGFIYLKHGLSFTHHNSRIRRSAVNKTKECVEFAQKLGAKYVSIGLIRGQATDRTPLNLAWRYLVECIRECGEFSSSRSIVLLVEPENRYETGYVHTVEEGVKLIEEVGLGNVRLMIDTFHMNMEESSMRDAVRRAEGKLAHVHLADNNRLAPGMGHIDFAEVIGALRSIGYDGYLGLEILLKPTLEMAIEKGMQHVTGILG